MTDFVLNKTPRSKRESYTVNARLEDSYARAFRALMKESGLTQGNICRQMVENCLSQLYPNLEKQFSD